MKIITASHVTDDEGNLACGTQSVNFNDINHYAQAYFGGTDIVGYTSQVTSSSVATKTFSYTFTGDDTTTTEITTGVYTDNDYGIFYTNSKGSIVQPAPPPSGVVISFATPFIYQPERGKTGATAASGLCGFENVEKEDFGYLPKPLFDFLLENEEYSSQYPGLESCILGGPSIWTSECVALSTTRSEESSFSNPEATNTATPGQNPNPPTYQTAFGKDLTEETSK